MVLTASCDALYFPSEPRDNVLTLQWSTQDAPQEPNTSVIFKVKCTAPQLFHALPRYGALLLADATGAAMSSSNQMATITFSRRENHSGGDGSGGASPSAVNRQAAPTMTRPSRASSATPGGPLYQERFAIEYVVISSEPLAFQQILSARADTARLTEVVKNVWSLIASGAIPRAHLSTQAGINLKVYMENVVLQRSDPAPSGGDEATKIVVPPEARLVPVASERRGRQAHDATDSSRSRPVGAPSPQLSSGGYGAGGPGSVSPAPRRKPADELRVLREEINSMRRESVTSTGTASGSVLSSYSPPVSAPNNQPRGREGTAAVKAPSTPGAAGANSCDDLIMKFDLGGRGSGGGACAANKEGLKVYVLLLLMLALYGGILFMRRSATRDIESG
ncbi:hypothetical protein LSCM1_07732 [Leishmania martiniquensis]|uniref:Uncharacterized protein n=1 Tax=Leishmania martiniquensis TaxID=1580590 RepID=A0A836GS01_9TRYP|nr:hypothetical protein LSCM1_07732 [Leishmania martiniquensis]